MKKLLKIIVLTCLFLGFLIFPNLIIANDPLEDAPTMPDRFNLFTFLIGLQNWFFFVVITLAVIFVIYGGYMFMTAQGDPQRLTNAKKQVIYALVGAGVVLLAVAAINFLAEFLQYS